MRIGEKMLMMAHTANASNVLVEVCSEGQTVAGLPVVFSGGFVFFDEAWYIESTGELGSIPTKAKKCLGMKMINLDKVLTFGYIRKPEVV